jgi:F-type H+-transporting ATPase subunit delta
MSHNATNDAGQDTVFDVDVEKLSKVYAQAGLNAAGDPAAQQSLMDELNSVLTEVLVKFPEVEKVFASALVSNDDKSGIIDRVFGKDLSPTALNFMKVIAKHGRLGILRPIIRSANALWQVRLNEISVKLELAHPIDESLQQHMIDVIGQRLGKKPLVTVVINPELIGGFVVRAGDRVLDASVRYNLERARQEMVARSIEAIQRTPEKFQQQEA